MDPTEENEPRQNQATYRDLVIFEERLKGNMTRLLKRKRKYEGFDLYFKHL